MHGAERAERSCHGCGRQCWIEEGGEVTDQEQDAGTSACRAVKTDRGAIKATSRGGHPATHTPRRSAPVAYDTVLLREYIVHVRYLLCAAWSVYHFLFPATSQP